MTPAEEAAMEARRRRYTAGQPAPVAPSTDPEIEAIKERNAKARAAELQAEKDKEDQETARSLQARVDEITTKIGTGPQQSPDAQRLAQIRDAASELVAFIHKKGKTKADVDTANENLDEFRKLNLEELNAGAVPPPSTNPNVIRATAIDRAANAGGAPGMGDVKLAESIPEPEPQKPPTIAQRITSAIGAPPIRTIPPEELEQEAKRLEHLTEQPLDKPQEPAGLTESERKLVDKNAGAPGQNPNPFHRVEENRQAVEAATGEEDYVEPPPLTYDDVLNAPLKYMEEPALKAHIQALQNDYHASPFKGREGEQALRSMLVDPLQLSTGDMAEDPTLVANELADLYTLAELRHLGYSSDVDPDIPPGQLKQIQDRSKFLATNKVLSIWGKVGKWNLLVMKDVEKSIKNAQWYGPVLAPFSLGLKKLFGAAAYSTVVEGRESTGIPVFKHANAMSSLLSGSFLNPIGAYMFGQGMTPELGGEHGWGGKRHLQLSAYGWDNFQAWEQVRQAEKAMVGAATPEELAQDTSLFGGAKRWLVENSPITKSLQMEHPEQAGTFRGKVLPEALTLGLYLPYILFDPNIINFATLGAGHAFGPTGRLVDVAEKRLLNESLEHLYDLAEPLVAAKPLVSPRDDAHIRYALDHALNDVVQSPESTAGRELEQLRAYTRLKLANKNAALGPWNPQGTQPTTWTEAEQTAATGKPTPETTQVPEYIAEHFGQKHHEFETGSRAAAQSVGSAQYNAMRQVAKTGAWLPDLEAAVQKLLPNDTSIPVLMKRVGDGLQAREIALTDLATDAELSRARVPASFEAPVAKGTAQQVLRALKSSGNALSKLATKAVNDWYSASTPHAASLVEARYVADLEKLGLHQITNMGDMAMAELVARVSAADDAVDIALRTLRTKLNAAGPRGVKLGETLKEVRMKRALALDAQTKLHGIQGVASALSPAQIRDALLESIEELQDSIAKRLYHGPAVRTTKPMLYPALLTPAGDVDRTAWVNALRRTYGKEAVAAAADSTPIGDILKDARPSDERRMRLFEETVQSNAHVATEVAPRAQADVLLNSIRHWRTWSRGDETSTAMAYKLLKSTERKLDLVGGTALGTMPAEAREVGRRTEERLRSSMRDLDYVAAGRMRPKGGPHPIGLDAVHDFLTTRTKYGNSVWNQDFLLPHVKGFEYLRGVTFADRLGETLTAEALAGSPLGKGDATRVALGKAMAALKKAILESKDADEFLIRAPKEVTAEFLKELGRTDSAETARMFVLRAINYAAAQYDGWLDAQRVFGTQLTAGAANQLNFLQVPEKSAIHSGDTAAAFNAAAVFGLPLSSRMKGPLGALFVNSIRTDADITMAGLKQGYGLYLPRSYMNALENSASYKNIAKEMAEFSDKGTGGPAAALSRLWSAYRVSRIYGTVLPRLALATGNVLGSLSEVVLEPGGLGRGLTNVAVTAPTLIPRVAYRGEEVFSGFALQQHLAEMATKGSTLGNLLHRSFLRFMNAADDDVLISATGERLLVRDERRVIAESGIKTSLATQELDQLARGATPHPKLGEHTFVKFARQTAKQIGADFTPFWMENFARWVEEVDSAQRVSFWWQLRFEGATQEQATERTLSRFLNFTTGITPAEGPFLGRLMMVWRFQRLFYRQLGENLALSMTKAREQSWWRTLTGQTPLGRMIRTYKLGVAAEHVADDVVDWRSHDDKEGDTGQFWTWAEQAIPWWNKSAPNLAGPQVTEFVRKHEKHASGKDITQQRLMLTWLQSLNQLYLLNAFNQAVMASTVGIANGVGIDTGFQTIGDADGGVAEQIFQQSSKEFADKVDPLLGQMYKNWMEDSPQQGALVPRGNALVMERASHTYDAAHDVILRNFGQINAIKRAVQILDLRRLNAIHEDPDGSLRIDANWWPMLEYLALQVPLLGGDVGRVAAAFDTPEMAQKHYGAAIARAAGALTGLVSVVGFDPASDWDYTVQDRAAELRDLEQRAEKHVKSKAELRP